MEPSARFQEIFLDLFLALPRQGPGSLACTARALALCRGLPAAPVVLDAGCGAGAATLHLATLCGGTILALDVLPRAVERLRQRSVAAGLAGRIRPIVGDLGRPPFAPESLDLVWSEGALYNLGIESALERLRPLLRPAGHLAFTDAVWRTTEAPEEVRAAFADYPQMGLASDLVAVVQRCGYELLDHFPLPDEAWWEDFYTPMEARIGELRARHAADPAALQALDVLAAEPELHRRHAASFGYEFFVLRRGASHPLDRVRARQASPATIPTQRNGQTPPTWE
jgi:SAM-dependent methyltransferase